MSGPSVSDTSLYGIGSLGNWQGKHHVPPFAFSPDARLGDGAGHPGLVTCVDMSHTLSNELANHGRTIFMARRSTGQIQEGPTGFSIAAVNQGIPGGKLDPNRKGRRW
jgi:hypothetical protein